MNHFAARDLNEAPKGGAVQPLPSTSKRIWIDLDNSPHVPFFAPIIEELTQRGYRVILTARDAYQVRDLADLFQFNYKCVGRHWGKNWVLKVFGTCLRAAQLVPLMLKERPALAVAHGSRSQTLASALLGIPSLHIFDYEFTNKLVFLKPTWLMTPAVIPQLESAGGGAGAVLQYPGIKEDVYVPTFKPDSSVKARLGIDGRRITVLLRPPASEAHYHNPKSDELFAATIEFLTENEGVRVIVLPRNQRQGSSIRKSWAEMFAEGKLTIPAEAEDGLNLIWHSDLVISGGGTMNREAAALRVPVYSIFQGKIGAVDRYLEKNGRLVLIQGAEDLRKKVVLARRTSSQAPERSERAALTKIVHDIIMLAESQDQPAARSVVSE